MLNDPEKLKEEREFAKQTRDKFNGGASSNASSMSYDQGKAAAPPSGKYGGFGSEDIGKYNYNTYSGAAYDPYTKPSSQVSQPKSSTVASKEGVSEAAAKNKKKKKSKKKEESDSSSENSSDSSSEESDEEKKPKKGDSKKGKDALGIQSVPKAKRQID